MHKSTLHKITTQIIELLYDKYIAIDTDFNLIEKRARDLIVQLNFDSWSVDRSRDFVEKRLSEMSQECLLKRAVRSELLERIEEVVGEGARVKNAAVDLIDKRRQIME